MPDDRRAGAAPVPSPPMIALSRCLRLALVALCAAAPPARAQDELPLITVTTDDTVIDQSCRVRVPAGVFIADSNGDGVIHIAADNITVEFVEGEAELIQVPAGTPWHTLDGVGIRIDGHTGVTLRRPHAHRFKLGIWATEAHGLVIEHADVSGGYADRLRSTPERSDSADILDPHANDNGQWAARYGAGICIERSDNVTIRSSFARRRQNGVILDRCTGAKVYDNDFSFLSGWGLAMWRTTGSMISRNAFDFCIRGYNEGVYLDGQGSAGILMFEQCSDNVIAENSATHSGRGLWVFAGSEATGRTPPPEEDFSYTGRGSNDNLIIGNDFSYAAMRGLEVTCSFDNRIIGNRFVECAASGIWAAWSQETLIATNEFVRNGQRPSGLERGGVSMSHSAHNIIRDNTFVDNRCGVHLWSEDDEPVQLGWHKANDVGAIANQVIRNSFSGDAIMLQVRDVQGTTIGGNTAEDVGAAVDASPGAEPEEVEPPEEPFAPPQYQPLGQRTPAGARDHLAGRDRIVIGDSFPWDHSRPIIRHVRGGPGDEEQVFELLGAVAGGVEIIEGDAAAELAPDAGRALVHIKPAEGANGYLPFRIALVEAPAESETPEEGAAEDRAEEGAEAGAEDEAAAAPRHEFTGAFLRTTWRTTFFKWGDDGEVFADPQQDLDAWRARAVGPGAVTIDAPVLNFRFAGGGPGALGPAPLKEAGFGADRFGLIARTRLTLPAGQWRFATESDDGVRVLVDGQPVIENWTRHAPTLNSGLLDVETERDVEIVVEHFEDRGYAVITLDIEPAGLPAAPQAAPHDEPQPGVPQGGMGSEAGPAAEPLTEPEAAPPQGDG